jgi:GxxExxY protein
VVELKAVESLLPLFESQLMTYMRLLKKPKGILLNFNVRNIFKEGQKTFVNEYFKQLD